jgi:hypothetical protein
MDCAMCRLGHSAIHPNRKREEMKTLIGFVIGTIITFAMVCILFKNFIIMCYNVGNRKDDKETKQS